MARKTTTPANAPESVVKEIDHNTQAVEVIDLAEYAITIKDGDKSVKVGALEIADEAVAAQAKKDAVERQVKDFSEHFFALARRAGSVDKFRAICATVESIRKWGKAPQGTDKHTRKDYQAAPQIWKVYKSEILNAWSQFNIAPGAKVKTLDDKGKPKEVVVDGINRLKMLKTEQAKVKKEQGEAYQVPKEQGGVVVLHSGEQKTTPKPKQEEAQMVEPVIAVVMGKLAEVYSGLDQDLQAELLHDLETMFDDYAALQDDRNITKEIIELERKEA